MHQLKPKRIAQQKMGKTLKIMTEFGLVGCQAD
jgi:hypothetical protein